VPYTRGGPKSRPLQAIWQEVQGLVASGFQELVISGINLAQYQDSQNDAMDFWDLVAWLDRMLVKHYGLQARLRLSSVDPSLMGEKALQVLEQACLVCPHVHISLQSASARILRCMGRTRTSLAALDQFLNRLAVFWPCFAFGVDLLTGFPGETDHDFQETLFFCQDLPLTYGHVFSFSPRPGTPAAQMDGQISKAVKKERSLQLRDVLARKRQGFLAELCQKDDLEMVVEQSQPCLGYCQYYTLCRLEDETSCHDKRTKIAVSPVYWTDQGLVVRRHC
jgi:tRNA A37 methylthiotransferase MiaB